MTEYRDFPLAVPVTNTGTAADDQVLMVGGVENNTGSSDGKLLEIYNPDTLSFAPAGCLSNRERNIPLHCSVLHSTKT